jgi:hypothetical protein
MLNYDDLFLKASSKNPYSAKWAPIYFEPVMGSGEKITVAIVAINDDGTEYKAVQAIRAQVIKAMYGSQHKNFSNIIEFIIDDINKHIETNGDFVNWKSSLHGAFLGSPKKSRAENMTGILRQAIQLTASLSSLTFNEQVKNINQNDIWSRQFKEQVIFSDRSLEKYFDAKFEIPNGRPITLFYSSDKLATNTCKLLPATVNQDYEKNKAKLIDLDFVREQRVLNFKDKLYELIINKPSTLSDHTLSSKVVDNIETSFYNLSQMGRKMGIKVVDVPSAETASDYLIRQEAA